MKKDVSFSPHARYLNLFQINVFERSQVDLDLSSLIEPSYSWILT